MIDVLLLGTGGMTPLPNRWLSSLLVRCNGALLLFDCGEGTQIPWRQFGWGFRRLGTICLSHWHADHVAGLPGLLHSLANAGRTETVTIYGPAETRRVVDGLRQIAPVLPFPIEVNELADDAEAILPAGLRLRAIVGEHRVPSLIYRLDLGRRRAFDPERAAALGVPLERWRELQSGNAVEIDGRTVAPDDVLGPPRRGIAMGFMTDTRPVTGAAAFLRHVDLLVAEGTYGDPESREKAVQNRHMTFQETATIARDAGAGALWLTHFSPSMERPEEYLAVATDVFPETTIGYTGLTTSLRFRDE